MLRLTNRSLFFVQLVAHLATLCWLLGSPTWVEAGVIFFVYFLTGCLGMTMTYHRLLTHRSWNAPWWFEVLGTILATFGATGSSLAWTAAHRQHHAKADRAGDPHSPKVLGYVRAQWLSMFSQVDIRRSPVIKSEFHRWMHTFYIPVLLAWSVALYLLGGWNAVVVVFLAPACVLWNAGSLINTVCHTRWLGYRNYDVRDNSVNNPLLGVLMWGEGWHNNHHRNQSRANIGEKWWELDIGYLLIRLLRKK